MYVALCELPKQCKTKIPKKPHKQKRTTNQPKNLQTNNKNQTKTQLLFPPEEKALHASEKMGLNAISNIDFPFSCGIFNFTKPNLSWYHIQSSKLIYGKHTAFCQLTTFFTGSTKPDVQTQASGQVVFSHAVNCVTPFVFTLPKSRLVFFVSFNLQFSITRIFIQFYPKSSTIIQMCKEKFSF